MRDKSSRSVVFRSGFSGRPDFPIALIEQAASERATHPRANELRIKEVVMSLSATARSVPGTLRQEVLIDGRHRLTTDEPEHLGGDDTGPAPHELFPAALAACVSTTLVMYARTKQWDVGEVTVQVDYDHRATPRRMEIDVGVKGDLDARQLARLEKIAAACPLRQALDAGIEFDERYAWRPAAEQVVAALSE
jgi:putative redox protein